MRTIDTRTIDQYRVIDSDTHVIEPPDLWTSRVSSKWGDLRPRTAYNRDWGMDCWIVGEQWLHPVAYYNWAGWKDNLPSFPPSLHASNPAGYDASARLRAMDECGIYAQILYPNVIGFETQAFLQLGDPELALACVRAYNDFQTDFAGAAPERLIPIAVIPYWDLEASVAEMQRCREMGHRGVLWAAKLHGLGQPRIISHHWDNVYAAAQDLELSLNLHVGVGAFTNDSMKFREVNRDNFKVTAYVVESATFFSGIMETIGTLLVSDVFDRFPHLQVVSVESGFGFLPFLLESLDWQWSNSSGPKKYPDRRLPSEKFFTNMYATFWFEKGTLEMLNLKPEFADRLMYETDFPHATSVYPGPASSAPRPDVMLAETMRPLSDGTVQKLLHGNAAQLYRLA
jgi:predicted TIM-barrel fold metal-dependent hydrolase